MTDSKDKWYHSTVFVALSLILLFPVGLVLLWTAPKASIGARIGVTALIACLVLFSMRATARHGDALALTPAALSSPAGSEPDVTAPPTLSIASFTESDVLDECDDFTVTLPAGVDDHATKPRYLEVARASGAFVHDRVDSLTRAPLQQIWLDHLLALATKDADGHESALFVLAYAAINERCRDAVVQYREALTPSGMASFEARTLEELVAPIGHVVGEGWESAFRARYLARDV